VFGHGATGASGRNRWQLVSIDERAANVWRRIVLHVLAPDRQASASATMWSMSTSDELSTQTES
jgi:hypothetical protein